MGAYQHAAAMVLLLLAMGTLLIAVVPVRQASPKPSGHTDIEPVGKKGKGLFLQNCVKCHGPDGKGQTTAGELAGAPDFTDPEWQEEFADSQLRNSITHGDGQMPAFGKKLSKAQINSLIRYVRTLRARSRGKSLSDRRWSQKQMLVNRN